MKSRHRAPVLAFLRSMTDEDHQSLKRVAAEGGVDWRTTEGEYGELVKMFRAEVKDHYYTTQRRRCCYCSIELQAHKITYDAEHILDKAGYPEYMFELGNIAASCKRCNQSKSSKPISASGLRFVELSQDKDAYSIVHPHLDEWHDHLRFDSIGRIAPSGDSTKGPETIKVCGIAALNAARLSDEFSLDDQHEAETALRTFYEVEDLERKRQLFQLISDIASRYDHPGSKAVVEGLANDVELLSMARTPTSPQLELNG